jgi:TldD protein
MGCTSNTRLAKDEVIKTARLAVETAKASSKVPKPVPAYMAEEEKSNATLTGPCEVNPFTVPNQEKAELLLSACDRMLRVPDLVMAEGYLQFVRLHRIIANSDGSYLDLTNYFSNPVLKAVAVVGSESQERSYQNGGRQAGYELIVKKWGYPLKGWSREKTPPRSKKFTF